MSMCEKCVRRNDLCVGFMDFDILKYLHTDLSLRKPYPAKIILGTDVFERIKNEMKQRGVYGLDVNLAGEYVGLFGMDIEIDKYCRHRIAFEGVKDFSSVSKATRYFMSRALKV